MDEKQAGQLFSALDTLTPQQRAVVVLRYCHDRSADEVAAILGVSAGTVRSIAYRAMTRLRTHPALAGLVTATDHHRATGDEAVSQARPRRRFQGGPAMRATEAANDRPPWRGSVPRLTGRIPGK